MSEEIVFNDEAIWKIRYDIFQLEKDNLKTKKKTDSEMVEEIRQIIIDSTMDKNF